MSTEARNSWLISLIDKIVLGVLVSGVLITFFTLFGYKLYVVPLEANLRSEMDDLATRLDEYTNSVGQVIGSLARIENVDMADTNATAFLVRQNGLIQRISEIEETLDKNPREVLDLIQVRAELTSQQRQLDAALASFERESHRNFTIVLSLFAALFSSFLLLVLTKFLQKGKLE